MAVPRARRDVIALLRRAVPYLTAIVALAAIGYLALELVPDWLADTEGLPPDARADERQDVRIAALVLLGGALGAWAVAHLVRSAAQGRSARATEGFTRAVEQLRSKRLEVRLGAIRALERIAREAPEMRTGTMEVLTTYVRERARPLPGASSAPGLRTDVQAALSAMGRRSPARDDGEEGPPVLCDCDLRKADLAGARLERANLMRADLEGADLVGANLEGANLAEANLEDAYLVGTNLRAAVLTEARLEGAYLIQVNLERADLTWAHLEGADLVGADLRGTDLTRACLREADFVGANLEWTDRQSRLEGADLSQTLLEEADLSRAHLEGAQMAGARLDGAKLVGTRLDGANLTRARLGGADLTGAHLDGADLREASHDEETRWPAGFAADAAVAPRRLRKASRLSRLLRLRPRGR